MRCPKCGNTLTLLFYSAECDKCDSAQRLWFVALWTDKSKPMPIAGYGFRTLPEADHYIGIAKLNGKHNRDLMESIQVQCQKPAQQWVTLGGISQAATWLMVVATENYANHVPYSYLSEEWETTLAWPVG